MAVQLLIQVSMGRPYIYCCADKTPVIGDVAYCHRCIAIVFILRFKGMGGFFDTQGTYIIKYFMKN